LKTNGNIVNINPRQLSTKLINLLSNFQPNKIKLKIIDIKMDKV